MAEFEPQKESNLVSILQEEGYKQVQPLPTEKQGIFFASAEKDGERFVLKAAGEATGEGGRIENQAIADQFLHENVTGLRIDVPQASLDKKSGLTLTAMKKVEGQVIAESKPDGMKGEMTESDVRALVEWLTAVRKIPAERIPEHFKTIAKNFLNEAFYRERLSVNAKSPIEQGTVTEMEFEDLSALWEQNYGTLSFQHHDVVPFNLIRKPDGSMSLIDAEFARLGMVGYDPAYFAIQTYALYNRADLAAQMLEESLAAWDKQFPEDNLRESILAPLAYRIVANLNDASTKQNAGARARTLHLKELILSGDVQEVIDGLNAELVKE